MLRDFYLNIANELMDFAEERIKEAERFQEQADYFIKMSEETPQEELIDCLRAIRKEHKITAEKIGKNMGVSTATFNFQFQSARNVSFAKVTRWMEGMGLDLVIFDPKGKAHRLARRQYERDGIPYFSKTEDNPEVWFDK